MGDPRNVAHAKKVSQERHHKDKHVPKAGPAASPHTKNVQTGKKPASVAESPAKSEVANATQQAEPTQPEKSLAVLSKLKELEFHSRAKSEKPSHSSSGERGLVTQCDRSSQRRETRGTNYQQLRCTCRGTAGCSGRS